MEYMIDKIPDLQGMEHVAIDLEMFGQVMGRLHIPHGDFACMSLSFSDGTNALIQTESLLKDVMNQLQEVPIWVFQNATYDLAQLSRYCDLQPEGKPLHYIWDTMLVEKVLYSGYYIRFSLKDMVRRYLGVVMLKDKYDDIADRTINKDVLFDYAIQDTVYTREIYLKQIPLLDADPQSKKVYNELDGPMVWVVYNMQPVKIDVQGWLDLATMNDSKAKSLEAEIGVNVMSYKKVKEMLNDMGIPVQSTGDEILAEFAGNPVVDKIRETRTYRTAVSKFGHTWVEKFVDPDGYVRSGWSITGASTGRLSSSDPNLMQIPSRKMPEYRNLFLSGKGQLIVADVAQQEPRLTALMSGDKNLTSVFVEGGDVHRAVAMALFDVKEMEKSDPRRKIGKRVGLGIVYGLSAHGLFGQLQEDAPEIKDLSEDKCQWYIDEYFKKFPAVQEMINSLIRQGHKQEFVRSPFGRKIHINIHSNGWERLCANAPHQSGGADMLKAWNVALLDDTREAHIPFGLIMDIHDECVLDVENVDVHLGLLDKSFKSAVELVFPNSPIPFEYEVGTGESWACKQ